MTVQPSWGIRVATPSSRRPSSSTYSWATGVCPSCDQRLAAHVAGLRHQRLLVRIAVCDELAAWPDDQRKAVVADSDLIDHPPHFFEADLAGQPARRLIQTRQVNRERRRREQVLVDFDRRHRHAVDRERRVLGKGDARRPDPARRDHRTALVEQRDLAEFAELQHVVLEDPILLPGLESGVLEIGGERLEQLGVGDDVAPDFFRRAQRDVLIAVDHRLLGAALEGEDRDHAVAQQRQHGGNAEQQCEARRDVTDLHRPSCGAPAGRRSASKTAPCSGRRGPPRSGRRNAC